MSNLIGNGDSFLRQNYTLSSAIESLLDPVIVVATLILSAYLQKEKITPDYAILSALAFALTFPGKSGLNEKIYSLFQKTAVSIIGLVFVLGVFGYSSGYINHFPKEVIYCWIGMSPVLTIIAHIICRNFVLKFLKERIKKSAVVVGVNEVGLRLTQQFSQNPYLGVRVIGFFDDRSLERLPDGLTLPTIGRLSELGDFVKLNKIDHIYLSLPMASQPRILNLLNDLKDTTASIFFAPDIFVTDLIQGQMHSIGNTPVVAVCETPFTGFRGVAKRMTDIFLSIIFITLLAPVMIFISIGVKLSSPGPAIFKQRRYGLDGKEILVYKFRSMTTCDNGTVVKQATKNDQRITPFGAFIRKTSLDELPQFINVLQGRMSIVGPRPHAVAHNETYRKLVKGYMVRHKVKPGITGWAQVCGYRGETETIEKMEKRIEYDLEYLRNWSIGLDLLIIFKTVFVVFKDKNAY